MYRRHLLAIAEIALAVSLAGCPSASTGGPNAPSAPKASEPVAPVPPAPGAALAALEQRYLDGLFAAKPYIAQYSGDHRFDGKHADLSPEALARRGDELRAQRGALEGIAVGDLSPDDRIDAEILRDGIDLELLYLDEIRDWEWDPRLNDSFPFYDPRETVAERFGWIIHGDYAPLSARLASLTEELAGLPRLLDQYRHNLKRPPRIYTEHGIEDNKGRLDLVKGEVADFIKSAGSGGASADAVAAAEKARGEAEKALGEYQTFLETDLLPRSDGDWRLGAARYDKKFPLALQTRITPDELARRAEAAFKESREELYRLAVELHAELLPKARRPDPKGPLPAPAEQKRIIEAVRDELAKDHPKAADYVTSEWKSLDELRAFIQEHDLLDLPPTETLVTQEMPAFKRGVIAAEYLSPGMLDRSGQWRATYSVDPIDPKASPAEAEKILRANNRYVSVLRAVHEAYPGHHVQTWYARKIASPLRAVLWNGAMAEGWAVYGEDVMTRLGLGGKDNKRYRFNTLRGHLVVAANALLDVRLQSGTMSDEEAVRFMVEEGFQEKATAEKKLVRAKLDSTQLCQYFLGYSEIMDMERDYRAKVGDAAFKQRTFDEALVLHGTIAVRYLRQLLLGGD